MRKILSFLLAAFLISNPVFATTQVFTNGQPSANITVGSNNFICLMRNTSYSTGEANYYAYTPYPTTFSNLGVVYGTSPGVGTSITGTLRVDAASTALTCTISDASTSCTDSTHSVFVPANTRVDFLVTTSGAATAEKVKFYMKATTPDSDVDYSLFINDNGNGFALSNSLTNYLAPTNIANSTTSESTAQLVMPISGTFSKLYVKSKNGTGSGSGKSYLFTLRKNGADTALTCTMTNATTCADNINSVSVAAGDLINVTGVPSSSPTAIGVSLGLRFKSSIPGTFLMTGSSGSSTASTSTTNFLSIAGSVLNSTVGNTDMFLPGNLYLRAMYVYAGTAPGGSASYTVTLRDNSATTDLAATCTITGASQSCSYVPSTPLALNASDHKYASKIVPASTPTASIIRVTYLLSTYPPATTTAKNATIKNAIIRGY